MNEKNIFINYLEKNGFQYLIKMPFYLKSLYNEKIIFDDTSILKEHSHYEYISSLIKERNFSIYKELERHDLFSVFVFSAGSFIIIKEKELIESGLSEVESLHKSLEIMKEIF